MNSEIDQSSDPVWAFFSTPEKAKRAQTEWSRNCTGHINPNSNVERSIWRSKSEVTVTLSSNLLCPVRETLPAGSTFVILQTTITRFEVAYLNPSKVGYWIGYIPRREYSKKHFEFFKSITHTQGHDTTRQLIEAEQYW